MKKRAIQVKCHIFISDITKLIARDSCEIDCLKLSSLHLLG